MNNPKGSPPRGGPAEATNLADMRQKSERNNIIWTTDLHERIVQPTPDINIFLETLVPSSIDVPSNKRGDSKCKPVDALTCGDKRFKAKVTTGAGKEAGMYKPLIAGLTHLVENFHPDYQPTFHNCANTVMNPPYELCDIVEHQTKPDIVVTVPSLPPLDPLFRWRNLALVFEVKGEACDDPMEKYSKKREATLIQLAKSARNLMLAQGRLFAFCVGIYGRKARIFRFDRAGAVCSPLFDYFRAPQHLHEFLWRFVHPIGEGCAVVGDDPTTSLGTEEDRGNAICRAKEIDPSYEENPKTVRRFTVTDDHGKEKKYLAYKLIFVNTRLCSRASMLWEAFELDDKDEPTSVRVVIKEAWRQFTRPSEIRHYQDLQNAAEETAEDMAVFLSGFAEVECGDDLGLRETKTLAEAGYAVTSDNRSLSGAGVATLDEYQLLQLSFDPAVVSGHRTVSACCRKAQPDFERGQIRMVIKTLGTSITDFQSTYQLVRGIRDAIRAHKRAYEAGIIHRDVSNGNVMFRKTTRGSVRGFLHDFDHASNWKRFLAELDPSVEPNLAAWHAYVVEEYAKDLAKYNERMPDNKGPAFNFAMTAGVVDVDSSGSGGSQPEETPSVQGEPQDAPHTQGGSADAPCAPGGSACASGGSADAPRGGPNDAPRTPENPKDEQRKEEQKQRTGTIYFMAVEILNKVFKITHEARHDLESFYWLLVWIVLRHVTCTSLRTWHQLFDCTTLEAAMDAKVSWLDNPGKCIYVPNNEPLTNLLEQFRLLCKNNVYIAEPDTRMTHDVVLHIFSVVLKDRKRWPAVDPAKRWTMPAIQPGDHSRPDGGPRTTGTLAFSVTTQEEAVPGVEEALCVASGAGDAVPGAGDRREQEQTGPDIEKGPINKGKGPVRQTVARMPPVRPVARTTSATKSQASGSHNAPPSSDEASATHGNRSPRLRKQKVLPRRLVSIAPRMGPPPVRATRSMDPPPAPVTRSMDPPSAPMTRSMEPSAPVTRSRSQSTRHAATSQGSRASKRSRSREDEVVEDDRRRAGTSHSPKRQRTFSHLESPKGPRKVKGKKRS